VSLPEQLLLSDLLRRRVRCDQGLDHGAGAVAWMHPPVHRLLGWISKPSAFGDRRQAWRLDQLRGLSELEALVKGPWADTDLPTVDRLPTLIEAVLLDRHGELIGTVADAAVELSTGRIAHYLVARSDPRLPGSSRWRLSPERITDQQPGQVSTALNGLDDLPLARASVRQEFLRRGRRWREQLQEETERLRDQFQHAGDRFEERLEGWLEEEPERQAEPYEPDERWPEREESETRDAWDDWDEPRSPYSDPGSPRRMRRPESADEDPWL
jgi:sporulation protein YlmC with PRC-barrel domain